MSVHPVAIKAATVFAAKENAKVQGSAFETVLKATMDQKLNPIGPIDPTDNAKTSPVQHVISSIAQSETRLRDLVHKGLTGTSMPPEKLIALQASVYRATLEIDVVSKGVEQTTSGFKTLLQSQI